MARPICFTVRVCVKASPASDAFTQSKGGFSGFRVQGGSGRVQRKKDTTTLAVHTAHTGSNLHCASSQPPTPFLPFGGVRVCGAQMAAAGFHTPSWEEFAHGVRPEPVWDVDFDPGLHRHGWERIATIPVHGELVEGCVRQRLSQSEQVLFRSQGGPLSSVPFTCFPTSPLTRFDGSPFPRASPSAPWAPVTPFSAFLLVWPCRLRAGRGVGSSRVCS